MAHKVVRKYVLNVLIGVDQLANAIALGDPDETLSSRAAKATKGTAFWKLSIFLEFIDPGHMKRTIEKDEGDDAILKSPERNDDG